MEMKEVHPLELRLAVGKQVAVNNLGRNENINKGTIENYKHTSTLPKQYSEE